jgi:ADP-ribosyl-[dinitrogen reductase] hydrolase
MTTQAAFSFYDRNEDWFTAAEEVMKRYGKAAGNGALMRTIPIALVYTEPEEVYRYSMDIARMTQADPLAGLTCALYCLMAQRFLAGEDDRLHALRHAGQMMDTLVDPGQKSAWEMVDNQVVQPLLAHQPLDLKPSGFTVDSLLCALWAFLRHDTFEEAVVAAINLGGDADTIGAICGGLAGVYWGYNQIPSRWVEALGLTQRKRLDGAIQPNRAVCLGS